MLSISKYLPYLTRTRGCARCHSAVRERKETQDVIVKEYFKRLIEDRRQRLRAQAHDPESFDEIVAILDRVKARWQSGRR